MLKQWRQDTDYFTLFKNARERVRPQKIRIRSDAMVEVTNSANQTTITKHSLNKRIYCPCKLGRKYFEVRPSWSSEDEQLFIFRDGSPLKSFQLRNMLRTILGELGLNPKLYDVHSFRSGRATDLQIQKYPVDTIKKFGWWKSNAVYQYLRD